MEQKNSQNQRNQTVINWYEKEITKDTKELEVSKNEIISSIKNLDKKNLFDGISIKKTKPKKNIWNRIIKAILGY